MQCARNGGNPSIQCKDSRPVLSNDLRGKMARLQRGVLVVTMMPIAAACQLRQRSQNLSAFAKGRILRAAKEAASGKPATKILTKKYTFL